MSDEQALRGHRAPTPEELRQFPLKDRWTPEEALALIETPPGSSAECIHGVPLPQFVMTREDKVRWANCVRIAAQSTGEPVASALVQQLARTMFTDRGSYPDG